MLRLPRFLLTGTLFIALIYSSPAQSVALRVRQDAGEPSSASSTAPPASGPASDGSTVLKTGTNSGPTPTSDAGSSHSSSLLSVSSTTSSKAGASTSSDVRRSSSGISTSHLAPTSTATRSNNDSQLPLQPEITPAIGIAGVIMMLSGAAYTFIGIRSRWLHVFLSTAYLIALAIVVLLAYVADPPISNAFQGAYLVAAVVPAFLIGCLSLLFRDLVEGLGCLLGGFCLGMWLLVLKDGSLISSSGGRIGLIVGFAVAGLSLSFSHYTRTYGLIACLSFAGATVITLGIDCYSRAGLKEFWLYIWNLNDKIFPLGSTTYPVTRGIKVEIACIIIVAVFGSASQMKLWNIVKERRHKKATARRQEHEDREHLEAENGRRMEDSNMKERAQWESTYGGKDAERSVSTFTATDSAHDSAYHSNPSSIDKSSSNVPIKGVEGVEMADLVGSSRRSSGTATSSNKAADIVPVARSDGPEIQTLPFTVSVVDGVVNATEGDDDSNSVATAGDSVRDHEENGARKTRWSMSRGDKEPVLPHHESRRSSLAATVDGLSEDGHSDLPALSRSATPLPLAEEGPNNDTNKKMRKVSSVSAIPYVVAIDSPAASLLEIGSHRRHSMHLPGSLPDSDLGSLRNLPPRSDLSTEQGHTQRTSKRLSLDTMQASNAASDQQGWTQAALPEGQSPTVLLYRTNEWAKHQAVADKPACEDLAPASEAGVDVAYGKEPAVPVDVQQLQQTAFPSRPPQVARSASKTSMNSGSQQSLSLGRTSSNPAVPVYSHGNTKPTQYRGVPRMPSNVGQNRTINQLSPSSETSPATYAAKGVSQRSSSTPQVHQRPNTNTLLGQREDRLQHRVSTMSFATPDSIRRSNYNLADISESPTSLAGSAVHPALRSDDNPPRSSTHPQPQQYPSNHDNMTLAQRRLYLQHRQSYTESPQPQPPNRRHSATSNNPGTMRTPSSSTLLLPRISQNYQPAPNNYNHHQQQQPLTRSSSHTPPHQQQPYYIGPTLTSANYNSHQPNRSSNGTITAATRESRLTSWRASMALDSAAVAANSSAGADLNKPERRRNSARKSDFNDLHHEKLRRLQSLAE